MRSERGGETVATEHGEATSVMGKSSLLEASPQEAMSLAARREGETGAGAREGMRCGVGQAPGCGGGGGAVAAGMLWRVAVRGEEWNLMSRAGTVGRMRADGGAWE